MVSFRWCLDGGPLQIVSVRWVAELIVFDLFQDAQRALEINPTWHKARRVQREVGGFLLVPHDPAIKRSDRPFKPLPFIWKLPAIGPLFCKCVVDAIHGTDRSPANHHNDKSSENTTN